MIKWHGGQNSTSAVKPKTTHKPSKPSKLPANQPNHPQISHKPATPATNQSYHPQTSQIPDKPPTNQPKIASFPEDIFYDLV